MRDVYYRNVPLFGQQRVVDNIVDDLVATAGLKREDFHVCASAKGLVASDCLIVTLTTGDDLPLSSTNGKGYPDLATLQFTRLVADSFPRVPIYALVDADPHGIDILSVYTHGSRANAHSADHAGLGLGPRLRWMGVKATDLWR
ncbi:hypothetical protein VHUM_03329 [Vanrija humicola]|uniref:DNA topoisomerase (ATP-hydrolyzing) n=1 Tax=Vanrija humicola TaxID=5417 RepID=A0A7D8YWC4_VANHU|nr:hypothetical protein VHUM_03329 [Vanrija humicola]